MRKSESDDIAAFVAKTDVDDVGDGTEEEGLSRYELHQQLVDRVDWEMRR